jgi:hypothetical protein
MFRFLQSFTDWLGFTAPVVPEAKPVAQPQTQGTMAPRFEYDREVSEILTREFNHFAIRHIDGTVIAHPFADVRLTAKPDTDFGPGNAALILNVKEVVGDVDVNTITAAANAVLSQLPVFQGNAVQLSPAREHAENRHGTHVTFTLPPGLNLGDFRKHIVASENQLKLGVQKLVAASRANSLAA